MANRVRKFREQANLTRDQLAGRMGISTSQLTKLERGERRLTKDWMEKIAESLQISPADLFDEPATSLVSVPLISWISAGALAQQDAVTTIEDCPMIDVAGLSSGDWIALRVSGDSMDRISPPDSIIVVDRNDRRLIPNACYIIADHNGDATYKRFRPDPMRFEPVSTNPSHEPIFPHNEVPVVGRVKRTMLDM